MTCPENSRVQPREDRPRRTRRILGSLLRMHENQVGRYAHFCLGRASLNWQGLIAQLIRIYASLPLPIAFPFRSFSING